MKLLKALREPWNWAHHGRQVWWRTVTPWVLRRNGVVLGHHVRWVGTPVVSLAAASTIEIGDACVLCSDSAHTALGVGHPVVLRTLRPGAAIRIGRDTGISGASICAAVAVEIGAQCLLGADVTICDTDFHALAPTGRRYNADPAAIAARPVRIGDNVFIGARAMVLKGVQIGAGSVVGAGAVVSRDVPAGVVVAGNPARIVGRLPGSESFPCEGADDSVRDVGGRAARSIAP